MFEAYYRVGFMIFISGFAAFESRVRIRALELLL
jgi:hypothetical protein